jgi:PAS domain S-box-containing protein
VTDGQRHDERELGAAVLHSVPDAIVSAGLDLRVRLVNPAAERLLGVRADDLRGRDALEALVDPADHALARGWAARLNAGEPVPNGVHARLVRGDGSRFSAEVSLSTLCNSDGERLGIVGTVRDVTARLAAEEDAATLRAIVDSATEAIVGVDRTGAIRFFSPSAERLYGWRAEEVIGKPVTILIAEHQLSWLPEVREALAAGRPVQREGIALRRDGTHVEAELNAGPILGADGRVRGTALTVLDISDRRRAQRLLDRIVEHAPASIAVKDLDGRYLLYGEQGAQVIGRSAQDIVGHTDAEVFPPSVSARIVAQDRRVAVSGRPLTNEETIRGPGGEVYVFVTTRFPLPGPSGATEAIGLIATDVTELRRAEVDRAQLAALVQAAPDAIVARDRDGLITTWNPGAEIMFGLSAEQAIGRPYDDLLVPADERGAYHALVSEVYAGRTATVRTQRLRADGRPFPVQISMAPLKLLDGSWQGTLSLIRDITDLVRAESELRERAALLERSNADLERFAYAASHDLQEPLNSIRLSAGAVIEAARERLEADERELMEHIDAAAARLSGQVRGLMEVAQVAVGRAAGERLPLAEALRDVIDSLRAAAASAGALIEIRQPVPDVQVPRTELAAALQNVIANAIKYRRPGVPPEIAIRCERGESLLEVRVADNGLGLSDADLDRVFGLFERGSSSEVPGTGMGLAVARRMLERLGGSMLAASEGPGRGCEFTLLLPLSA